jgi:predicted ATPase with chaperone activity
MVANKFFELQIQYNKKNLIELMSYKTNKHFEVSEFINICLHTKFKKLKEKYFLRKIRLFVKNTRKILKLKRLLVELLSFIRQENHYLGRLNLEKKKC